MKISKWTWIFLALLMVVMVGCRHSHDSSADLKDILVPLPGSVPTEKIILDWPITESDENDFNDAPYSPKAWHKVQRFEWLGFGVSEEGGPRDEDTFDDGMVVVNPSNFKPNNIVVLAVHLVTSYGPKTQFAFDPDMQGGVGIWIDWDYDKTFTPAEEVFNKGADIPFVSGKQKLSHALLLIPVTVPADFEPQALVDGNEDVYGIQNPPIRVRAVYGSKPIHKVEPGGDELYGEVEDHITSLNNFAFYQDRPDADLALTKLPQALQVKSRFLACTPIVFMAYSLEGEILFSEHYQAVSIAEIVSFLTSSYETGKMKRE